MKIGVMYMAIVGVLLLFFGVATFILNYERQAINLSSQSSRQTILEYHAQEWDPFPHYVKFTVDTQAPVILIISYTAESTKNKSYTLQLGEELVAIYPGETLRIRVENPQWTAGTIGTVLWSDLWNYTAIILIGTGILLLSGSAVKLRRQRVKEKRSRSIP